MEVTLEALDPKLLANTRLRLSELHSVIEQIIEDPQLHDRLLKVATFPMPNEKGRAHQQKQNMTSYYGKDLRISGLAFSVARSVDNTEEYLAVQYLPKMVEEGAWEEYQEEKAEKAAEAKLRKRVAAEA